MSAPLVVITDSNLPSESTEEELLEPAGFDVVRASCRSEQDVIEAASGADALIVQWAPITAAVIERLERCRLISRLGIGLDMIDLAAASERGITVLNTPEYCIEEVAAHAVALALAASRQLAAFDRSLRAGGWSVTSGGTPIRRPSAAVFAVIGFGRIGRRVADIARALGFRVVVHDRFLSDEEVARQGHRAAALEDALAEAQIVSLHLPLGEATRHVIDAAMLARMPEGSFLVNTSRGGLIDEEALASALRGGQIGGAALDVFEHEPLSASSSLLEAPHLLLTPHAAWYSAESLAELPREAARNVLTFFSGEPGGEVSPGA